MNRPSRIYATIDLDAVTWNLENMRKNISEDTKIIAVLKADAYGHGASDGLEGIQLFKKS